MSSMCKLLIRKQELNEWNARKGNQSPNVHVLYPTSHRFCLSYGPAAKLRRDEKLQSTDGFFYGGQSFSLRSSSTRNCGSSEAGGGGRREGRLSASSMAGVAELMAKEKDQRKSSGALRATGATMVAKGTETL